MTDESTASTTDNDTATESSTPEQDPGDDLGTFHQQLIAASTIEVESDAARIDGQWTKSLVVIGYPDTATTGMLDRALVAPEIDFEYSIHIHPRDTDETIAALKNSIRDLEVKRSRKAESGDVTQLDTQHRLDDHTAIYERLLDGTQQVFTVSIYLTVRAASKDAVDRAADQLRSELEGAQLTPRTAACRQRDALVATSPIGQDAMKQTVTMLGGAVGCLFPFSMGTHIEDGGIPLGYHARTGAPVAVDRFQRETGYNCLVMGNTGAGKTFTTLLTLLRRLGKDRDTVVIIADPFGDLGQLTDLLNGERITVSGSQALNPLDLKPTPQRVLEANPDLDPYKRTIQQDAIGFLEAFFEMEGMTLEGKRGLLSVALHAAYRRAGITPDPTTHDNSSPTLRDVRDVLQEVVETPTAFIDSTPDAVADTEAELWQRRASQLRMDLAPFRADGEYEHLGRATEIDLHGSDVVYLDLQQLEGAQRTGITLQLLLHAVYERAKQTEKRVIFAIDEAHYLLQTGASLEFLERAVRHARHYDLSLQFITQTADEFFSDDYEQAAKVIADNCAVKLFHQVEGLSDTKAAEWLRLSPPEAAFVRNAQPGSEECGYSQALVEVGDVGRIPVNVRALPEEISLITGDHTDLRASHDSRTPRTEPTTRVEQMNSGDVSHLSDEIDSSESASQNSERQAAGEAQTQFKETTEAAQVDELPDREAVEGSSQLFNKSHSIERSESAAKNTSSRSEQSGGDGDG